MIQCQVEIIMSCRDGLNDLEELIYSIDPKRVNVPSKIEQLSFLTSTIWPRTVLKYFVRNFSERVGCVLAHMYVITDACIYSLILFSTGATWKWPLDVPWGNLGMAWWPWAYGREHVNLGCLLTIHSLSYCQMSGTWGWGHHSWEPVVSKW